MDNEMANNDERGDNNHDDNNNGNPGNDNGVQLGGPEGDDMLNVHVIVLDMSRWVSFLKMNILILFVIQVVPVKLGRLLLEAVGGMPLPMEETMKGYLEIIMALYGEKGGLNSLDMSNIGAFFHRNFILSLLRQCIQLS